MNEYDSSKMAEVLKKSHGFELADSEETADMLLLNTCSVREKAQEKVFSQLGRWRPLKEKNPDLIIGVGGCVASQEGSEIIRRMPFVDLVFGPQTLHRLPQLYEQKLAKGKPSIDVSFPEIEKFDKLPEPKADGPTAYVSIMEGCSKYCSFCVVPYTRGEEISRPFDDVLAECALLAEQGVREITLLGQNVNDYQGTMHNSEIADLALLINYVAAIEGIGRIRFSTSHPLAFSDNLIEAYANVPKLANQLHLPVQSGSDRILSLMKRGYTALEYKSKMRKLRRVRPDIKISSDFIIGFPGETTADFQDTMNLIHDIGFDNSYSFIYSPRPGTPAANLEDKTTLEEKKQRLNVLQNRIALNTTQYNKEMVGSTQTILLTGPSKKDPQQLSGRTECNRVVHLGKDITLDQNQHLVGQFVQVKIKETLRYSLLGELIV